MKKMKQNTARFRFYEELNDFLPPSGRKVWFEYRFDDCPAIKDCLESLGVPHNRVDLILVNGESVNFAHQIKDGDRISVYPVFESIDISKVSRLRPKPLRELKFIADAQLGQLARYLRLAGFDTLYQNDYSEDTIIKAVERRAVENRIVLTGNRELLKNKVITRGYLVRAADPKEQLAEVMARFDLIPK